MRIKKIAIAAWCAIIPVAALPQSYSITTAAGGALPVNVAGTAASLTGPQTAIATDSAGNIFFADGNTVLRLDAGTQFLTLVAGNGTAGYSGDNGPAVSAQLHSPTGICVDNAGNIYIAEGTDNVIREVSQGIITTIAGTGVAGFSGDNLPATSAALNSPSGLAIDPSGNLYIADYANNRIRKISNGIMTTVAGIGTPGVTGDNGPALAAQLNSPYSIALDSSGNLYVNDYFDNKIRKISSISAVGTITTIAGNGTQGFSGDNGPATAAQLNLPFGVTTDAAGNVYVADYFNYRVRRIANGIITTVAGNGTQGFSGDGAAATAGQLDRPFALTVDSNGSLYIVDYGNSRIRKVAGGLIVTAAGNGMQGFSGDGGSPSAAQLNNPGDVAFSAGTLYIADAGNNRVRTVTNGVINTVAGNGTAGFSGDNGPALSAQLNSPGGLALDPAGNLYISDTGNGRIRKVSSSGVITTLAGTGATGFGGDGGPAGSAVLNGPAGLALDAAGNLYVADYYNNRIREISGGNISTIAGNGTPGSGGDGGPATAAQLYQPSGVSLDAAGNLYIADTGNNRLRMVANGTISTVAGTSTVLNMPTRVLTGPSASLLIADTGNGVIRRVSAGNISTIAGGGVTLGDNGPATSALLSGPSGIALGTGGTVYIADTGNRRIRLLTPQPLLISGPATLPTGSQNIPYAGATLIANGGSGTYTWSVTGLPPGLTFSTSGVIAGTPTQAAAYVPHFTVNDAGGSTAGVTLALTVSPPGPPSIATLSPASAGAASGAFTLTIVGAAFLPASQVKWNAASLTTTYSGPTQVTAAVPANLLAAAGSANITVVNPGNLVSSSVTFIINPPPPNVTTLSPSSIAATSAAFTLTVSGTGFLSGAVVQWNGAPLATAVISTTQLKAQVTSDLLATAGTVSIVAANTTGLPSAAATFTINPGPPNITGLTPPNVPATSAAFTLAVNGTGFISGATVQWNGTLLKNPTFVDSTQITASVPANLVAASGSANILVTNPGNAASHPYPFTINPPPPVIKSLNPTSIAPGAPSFTLTVNGTGFLSGSLVQWNGSVLPTAALSATQLKASVGAGQISTPGTATIVAVNPGNVTSAPATFAFDTLAPDISGLTPVTVAAGAAGFNLTVTGSNFVTGSAVQWNGTALTTTFGSATQLTAAVTAALLKTVSTATLTVVTPAGLTSGQSVFNITQPPPIVTSLSPATAVLGSPTLTVTIKGTGFISGSIVQWNGTGLTSTFGSATQLTATVPATLLVASGTATVIVTNPGSLASAGAAFAITPVPPVIAKAGVVPIYSSVPTIEPGSWVSIYGSGLSAGTAVWNGDFPTTLGGTSVTINKKPAYLWAVTPGQINLQAPDDTATGTVNVVVTTGGQSVTSAVNLAKVGPSFSLSPASTYAAGVILTPKGSGANGGGTYDLLGPAGHFPYATRAAKVGEILELFGVGFGATKPAVAAGALFSGAAPTTNAVVIKIGGVTAQVLFSGMTSAGLYQFNVIVPKVAAGDQPLVATVAGVQSPANVFLPVQ